MDDSVEGPSATINACHEVGRSAHIRDTIRNTTERMSTRDPQLSDYQSSLEELLTCLHQL